MLKGMVWSLTLAVVRHRRLRQSFVHHSLCCSNMSTVRLPEDSNSGIEIESDSHPEPLSPPNSKILRVSMLGMPNAGKSTLVNQLMATDVCPVSKRAHTTRTIQQAIYLNNNIQVVLTDTPGVVNKKEAKKFSFAKDFVQGPRHAIKGSDLVAVIQDVSNPIFRHKLDPRIVEVLNECRDKPSVLILNKVDTLKTKRVLLETIRNLTKATVGGKPIPTLEKRPPAPKRLDTDAILNKAKARKEAYLARREKRLSSENEEVQLAISPSNETSPEIQTHDLQSDESPEQGGNGWAHFQDIFMISALHGDGIELLKEYFMTNAIPAPWIFNQDVLTDCPPTELALRIVKSKLLEHLPQEMPYQVTPVLEYWDENDSGGLRIIIGVNCPNERVTKRMIGLGGATVNVISLEVEKSLTRVLQRTVDLHINVKCTAKDKPEAGKPK